MIYDSECIHFCVNNAGKIVNSLKDFPSNYIKIKSMHGLYIYTKSLLNVDTIYCDFFSTLRISLFKNFQELQFHTGRGGLNLCYPSLSLY